MGWSNLIKKFCYVSGYLGPIPHNTQKNPFNCNLNSKTMSFGCEK